MALTTHHTQLSFPTSTSRSSLPCTRSIKVKSSVALCIVNRIDKSNLLKRRLYFRIYRPVWKKLVLVHSINIGVFILWVVCLLFLLGINLLAERLISFFGSPMPVANRPILSSSRKLFKVSFFKGNSSSGESEIRNDDYKSSSSVSSIQLSYVKPQNEEAVAGSPDKQRIFSKWLLMLWSATPLEKVESVVDERSVELEIHTAKHGRPAAANLLNATWSWFLGLDLAIKLPIAIFVPCFLAFNVIYGGEIVKELAPLWTVGPLIIFLYVKLVRGICSLYIVTFKKAVMVVRGTPGFSLWLYNYIKEGNVQAKIRLLCWQPLVDMKNRDYKAMMKSKLNELEEWSVEKYLDYVESIWPHYCRAIRFLKNAKLI